ncbi:hypothetical protein WNY37_13625 [Henriciella sp. AS95]|uniref:hypothetical protein n=1 Tax=Henriciella sp. AS95 TaxID=3135782 RepID=UPI00316E04D1
MHIKDLLMSAAIVGMLATTASCSGGNEASSDDDHAGEPAHVVAMHNFMNEEIDVVADKIWDKQGYIITVEGEEKLFPTTDEGWQAVADAADEMAALSEVLATEKYSLGEQDWVTYSEGLAVAAEQVKGAAIAQDEEAVFEAGGLMYRVCRSCHERFRTYGEN